jgi:hypothetical protein
VLFTFIFFQDLKMFNCVNYEFYIVFRFVVNCVLSCFLFLSWFLFYLLKDKIKKKLFNNLVTKIDSIINNKKSVYFLSFSLYK